jgi:serine/threonine protein phosphatase PrpC
VGWKAVVHSAIGTSHQKQEIPCQDRGDYRIFNDVIVGAVADGAGSAKYSDVGAKLAVDTILKCFADINESLEQRISQPLSQEEIKKLFEKIVKIVITNLHDQANSQGYSVDELACTLLVFVATPDWLAAMQIGDGFIVVRLQDLDYQLLFQPDKGEFANETTFITSNNALEEMKVDIISGAQEFISASTDGLEKVAIRMSDWQPFPPFFQPFEEYLQETAHPEQENEYLMSFLNSERLNARTDDDKTLLLCLFNKD